MKAIEVGGREFANHFVLLKHLVCIFTLIYTLIYTLIPYTLALILVLLVTLGIRLEHYDTTLILILILRLILILILILILFLLILLLLLLLLIISLLWPSVWLHCEILENIWIRTKNFPFKRGTLNLSSSAFWLSNLCLSSNCNCNNLLHLTHLLY